VQNNIKLCCYFSHLKLASSYVLTWP